MPLHPAIVEACRHTEEAVSVFLRRGVYSLHLLAQHNNKKISERV